MSVCARRGLLLEFVVLVFVVLVSAAGCTEPSETPSPEEEPMQVTFNVNQEVLGDTVRLAEYGLQFQPPRQWRALPSAQIARVRQAVQAQAGTTNPLHVYADTARQSFMAVSTLVLSDSAENRAQSLDMYAESVRQQHKGVQVRRSSFRLGSLPTTQFLVQDQGRVIFRLLVEPPTAGFIQFDYVVPHAHYAEALRLIESSIGSIQPKASDVGAEGSTQ